MAADWDPDSYLAFADARMRPARDLLDRLGDAVPGEVVDLAVGADAHDFDARDGAACLGGVVALAPAHAFQIVRAERVHGVVGAAGLLVQGAHGPDLEDGGLGQGGLATHGHGGSLGAVHEVEPEQDAGTAGAVDLASPESLPDRLAVASLGVHGHQPPRMQEARHALGVGG